MLAFLPVPTDEVTNRAAGSVLYRVRTTTPGRLVWPASKGGQFLADPFCANMECFDSFPLTSPFCIHILALLVQGSRHY